ncbi:MAG: phospholipase D-like domain-containing protein [Candidatus Omnitrophota bacterium]
MKKALFVLVLITATTFLGCAARGLESELILNDDYFHVAHREIQNADESIYLIAYLFIIYDYQGAYSNRLLKDIIEAKNRGVDVRVVLEYPKPDQINEEGPVNQKVYEELTSAGIDTRFDSAEKTTHSKVLVIDRETIIIGSHNYSFGGLKYNNETSLLIKDKTKAKKLIEYFEQID